MDIRQPLSTLRMLLEQRLGVDLSGYQFWLQDSQVVLYLFEAHCFIGLYSTNTFLIINLTFSYSWKATKI